MRMQDFKMPLRMHQKQSESKIQKFPGGHAPRHMDTHMLTHMDLYPITLIKPYFPPLESFLDMKAQLFCM